MISIGHFIGTATFASFARYTFVVLWCFGVVFPESANSADAYESARKIDADRSIAALGIAGGALAVDQRVLLTLNRPIGSSRIVDLAARTGATVSGVFLCVRGGGILSFFIDPSRPLAIQMKEARETGNKAAIALVPRGQQILIEELTPPSASGSSEESRASSLPRSRSIGPRSDSDRRGPPPVSNEDLDAYCGVELSGDLRSITRFRTELKTAIHMAEVTSLRRRMMPLNLVGR